MGLSLLLSALSAFIYPSSSPPLTLSCIITNPHNQPGRRARSMIFISLFKVRVVEEGDAGMGCVGWDLGGQSSISPSATNSLSHSGAITTPHPPPAPLPTHTLVCFLICEKRVTAPVSFNFNILSLELGYSSHTGRKSQNQGENPMRPGPYLYLCSSPCLARVAGVNYSLSNTRHSFPHTQL